MAEQKKTPWWHSTVDAFDTFLRVPGTVSAKGAHVRDGIDLKRVMIMVFTDCSGCCPFSWSPM